MRSTTWDEKLLRDCCEFIDSNEVLEAFQLLVNHAQTLPGFWVQPKMHGLIRTLVYDDMGGDKQPFSVIINRNSLLFYVRKSGVALLMGGIEGLQGTFPQTEENSSGELTVRLTSPSAATGLLHYLFDLVPIQASSDTAVSSISTESQERLTALRCSSTYAKAVETYSNKFVNGAGMQKPGTRGFELWLIYSTHTNQTGNPPTLREAIDMAKEYGLNTTSAANALGKWSAYYGFRPPRKGEYAVGPRSHLLDPVPIQKIPESGLSSISTKRTEMSIIKVPAAIVRQGDLTLFTTSIKVRDLIVPGFYSVETLDPDNANDSGYQRLLNTARAKRLADYVVEGQDTKDAFLPTSVFLATDKSIPYDPETHLITIDVKAVGPFGVVDGQHRLEGLRLAAARDERVLDFDVAVNIANALPKIHQMCHFLIVNTTQKSVEAGVEQRIIARLTEAIDIEDLPMLPKWIRKRVELGDVAQAIRLADYLNQTADSPWNGKVTMANAAKEGSTINQKSLVKAIVKYVLTANNPLNAFRDFEKEKKIFLNYWKAIAALLDDGNSAVLYKYNGVELFCKFSIPFFMKLQVNGNFTVSAQTELLKNCLNNVEGDYAGVGHPDWWASGGKASFLNSGAINQVAGAMGTALNTTSMSSKIEI